VVNTRFVSYTVEVRQYHTNHRLTENFTCYYCFPCR